MENTRLVVGNPTRGDDFWDRKTEIEEIWRALEKEHVLLVAPRRFGKTSIMLNLMDEPRPGYTVFYLDTEWVKGPADFIAELATQLLKNDTMRRIFAKAGGVFSKTVNRIKGVQVTQFFKIDLREEVAKDWHNKGREFMSQIKSFQGRLLLIVDELPLLVHRMLREDPGEAEDFLYWLRGVRQMPDLPNVRFVIGGSIGIEHVLKNASTGTKVINDLHRIQVGPFSEGEARKFIRTLLRNEANMEEVSTKVLDHFMQILETPVPYFAQILVDESMREARKQGRLLSPQVITRAYEERVLAAYNRTYFEHYYARLGDLYSEEEARLARAFLLEIARRDEVPGADLWQLYRNLRQGKGNEEDFSHLLSDLANDFYIQQDPETNGYRFATKVLKDWWLRHYAITE